MIPNGFIDPAEPSTTVGTGEGTAVWLPEAAPVLKVVADTSVVPPIMVVDPTTEVEVTLPGFTRTVVVVDAGEVPLAVVEAEA